jgi:hypothetical protein
MRDFTRILAELIEDRDKLNVAISAIADLQAKAESTPKPRGRPPGSVNRPKPISEHVPDTKLL